MLMLASRFEAEGLLERHLRVPFTLSEADLTEAIVQLAQAYMALPGWTGDSTALTLAETTVV